jgi:hypothetical protein
LLAGDLLGSHTWIREARAATPDVVRDTFNGLLAFVVPGHDEYSIAQGVSSTDPGGVDAGVMDVLIATIDESTPYVPQFSLLAAALLNGIAQAVNATGAGPFVSPFARLSFAEKTAVFQIMDGNDAYKVLASVLPAFVAYFIYSEAGAFDPATRSLSGTPLGWRLASYAGVADGRDEFLGYLGKS